MDLHFHRGDPANPSGHALVFFTDHLNDKIILSTYMVAPPIEFTLAKYMPPMFASHIPQSDVSSVSAIPLPPVPEQEYMFDELEQLAVSRGDDLVSGGTVDTSDVEKLLIATGEAAQAYLRLYKARPALPHLSPVLDDSPADESDVDNLLIPLMSDKDKLGEISRLAGSMRYAVEGNDLHTAEDIRSQMESLGKHLGDKFKITELIKATLTPGIVASQLSALYTERCYRLCEEDYMEVARIEGEIDRLNTSPDP